MEEDRYRLDQVREDIMKTSNNNAVQGWVRYHERKHCRPYREGNW
jgi:hypothetical protein